MKGEVETPLGPSLVLFCHSYDFASSAKLMSADSAVVATTEFDNTPVSIEVLEL